MKAEEYYAGRVDGTVVFSLSTYKAKFFATSAEAWEELDTFRVNSAYLKFYVKKQVSSLVWEDVK